MNKMVFISLVLLLMCMSSYAQAEIVCPSDPNICDTGYVNITVIKSWGERLDVLLTKSHNCSGPDVKRYSLFAKSNRRYDYALLLSAFTADKLVNLRFRCIEGHPEITGIRVKR